MNARATAAEIDDYLADDVVPELPVIPLKRHSPESNFATEAYLVIRDLQEAIRRIHGCRDYCNETADIRARLVRDGNDPDALQSRLNAHARRLDVELRALTALFFGTNFG